MTYSQDVGRPHSGLANPEKFSLTEEEVLELILEGEWENFLSRWKNKDRNKGICPSCGERFPEVTDWSKGNLCLGCSPREHLRAPRKKQEVCGFCKESRRTVTELAGKPACKSCFLRYEEMLKSLRASASSSNDN